MIRTSSIFVVCALALGCSSSDDGGPAVVDDTGTVADDTGTTGDDTGTMTDTGTADDTGSMSDGTSSETSTETGGETGGGPSCSDYCSKVIAGCTGNNEQYAGIGAMGAAGVCAAMCPKMATGMASDTSGDTLGCRMHYAELASTSMPGKNCPSGGAYGGGTCGSRCAVFCKLAMAQCGGVSGTPFTSEAECNTKCADQVKTFNTAKSEVDTTAKTFNCMQYHLQAAYSNGATSAGAHCMHLTLSSGPCGT
jgi:hypothetical protein